MWYKPLSVATVLDIADERAAHHTDQRIELESPQHLPRSLNPNKGQETEKDHAPDEDSSYYGGDSESADSGTEVGEELSEEDGEDEDL
ncbi:hypothetical protein HKX48_002962 [Thoreauomyces humboldtii]|nr:hypothetical protein HKX48_002962 [Thoreauomyces humboldtii]